MSKSAKNVVGADPAVVLIAEVREMIADLPEQFRRHVDSAAVVMRQTVSIASAAGNPAPSLAMLLVGLEVIVAETAKQGGETMQ